MTEFFRIHAVHVNEDKMERKEDVRMLYIYGEFKLLTVTRKGGFYGIS